MKRSSGSAVLVFALIRCAPDSADVVRDEWPGRAAPAEIRDSAGVRHVRNHDPLWGDRPAWHVWDEPIVRIGVVEGEDAYLFSGDVDAARLVDGRIAVLDGGSKQLRLFSPSGEHLWSAAGAGTGPGEFSVAGELQRLERDVLQIEGNRRAKRVRFGANGQLLEDAPVPWAALLDRAGSSCRRGAHPCRPLWRTPC